MAISRGASRGPAREAARRGGSAAPAMPSARPGIGERPNAPPPRGQALAPAGRGRGGRAGAEKRRSRCAMSARVMAAQGLVGDLRRRARAGAARGRRAFPACRSAGPRSRAWNSISASGCARREHLADRLRRRPNARGRRDPGPRAAWRSAGSCPAPISGSAVSMARKAALRPALSPSKHRIGSLGHRPQQRALIGGQRRAERRDGLGEARLGHRDHVDIALDDDDLAALVRGLARAMVVEEQRALVKELASPAN